MIMMKEVMEEVKVSKYLVWFDKGIWKNVQLEKMEKKRKERPGKVEWTSRKDEEIEVEGYSYLIGELKQQIVSQLQYRSWASGAVD